MITINDRRNEGVHLLHHPAIQALHLILHTRNLFHRAENRIKIDQVTRSQDQINRDQDPDQREDKEIEENKDHVLAIRIKREKLGNINDLQIARNLEKEGILNLGNGKEINKNRDYDREKSKNKDREKEKDNDKDKDKEKNRNKSKKIDRDKDKNRIKRKNKKKNKNRNKNRNYLAVD